MKHVNAEMIKAVADNTELVIFFRQEGVCRWSTANIHLLIRDPEYREFFLCLPQHKEACLHWLNGGEAEENYKSEWSDIEHHEWHDQSVFNFDDGYTIRIKPKKEKRWIATLNGWNASQKVFASKQEAVDLLGANSYQFHEIEVEV